VNGQMGETGLEYRRNRYYDPQQGRFTQEDPIGLAGGMNLYGFAGGDPVNFSDPLGLWVEPQGLGTMIAVSNLLKSSATSAAFTVCSSLLQKALRVLQSGLRRRCRASKGCDGRYV